jgi:hypothetical protein
VHVLAPVGLRIQWARQSHAPGPTATIGGGPEPEPSQPTFHHDPESGTKSAEAPSKARIKQSTNVSRALGRPNQEMRADIVILSLLNRGAYIQLDDPLRASQAWTPQITHGPIVHACTCFEFPCSFDLTMEPPPFTGRRIVDRALCVWYYAHSAILRTCLGSCSI